MPPAEEARGVCDRMDRHSPEHPLPEEIQQMGSSETVCHYCGVSYLVFHEFQRLQERLRAAERELESRGGGAEREQLEELRTTHSQLCDRLCVLGQQLDGEKAERADVERQLEMERERSRRLGRKTDAQQQCLRVALSLLHSTHQGLQEVQQSFCQLQDVWKEWSNKLLESSCRVDTGGAAAPLLVLSAGGHAVRGSRPDGDRCPSPHLRDKFQHATDSQPGGSRFKSDLLFFTLITNLPVRYAWWGGGGLQAPQARRSGDLRRVAPSPKAIVLLAMQ
ncbi:leucine-, glutamate- and lysine-rich protein 1 isoform X1 [Arapaima gigas]